MDVKRFVSSVPTPLGGLALGLSSIGGSWSLAVPSMRAVFSVFPLVFGIPLVLLVILKFCLKPALVKEELQHHVVGSVMPTLAMATMVIAQSLLEYIPGFARGLWLSAIAVHLVFFVCFGLFRFDEFKKRQFEYEKMVPSWFIPPIGIVVAAVTSTGMGFENLADWLFLFGISCYCIKLPVMIYRLFFRDAVPHAALPTFAVMAAPASLCLAGYLTINPEPGLGVLILLVPLALIMTGIVYIAFFRLLRLPFSPGYAAFTFPLVIGATALFKLVAHLDASGAYELAGIFQQLAWVELVVASVMVSYVAFRFFWHLCISKKA